MVSVIAITTLQSYFTVLAYDLQSLIMILKLTEGAGFINAVSGSYRRTLYSLTPSGRRLFELH
jgi:DNA-binding MarR family transcriptional regulator